MHLPHKHSVASKDGVGIFTICVSWRNKVKNISFQPEFSGAGHHPITERQMLDILEAGSAAEAMAIIRTPIDKIP